MPDNIADDILRSGYDRWLRLEELRREWDERRPHFVQLSRMMQTAPAHTSRRIPGPSPRLVAKGNGIAVEQASDALRLCAWLCKLGRASDDEPEERRGYMISCRLTGLWWGDAQRAIGDVAQVGDKDAGRMWAPHMKQPDERYVGYVYSAFAPRHPQVVKVGFSRKPEARMKSLSRHYGEEIVLGTCIPGTMLHEWAIHQIIFRAVAAEWYRASDIPAWLLPLQLKTEAA